MILFKSSLLSLFNSPTPPLPLGKIIKPFIREENQALPPFTLPFSLPSAFSSLFPRAGEPELPETGVYGSLAFLAPWLLGRSQLEKKSGAGALKN